MPSRYRVRCQVCGRHENEAGPISWRGKCGECGPRIAEAANDQMHYHAGPVFDHWRRRSAAALGALLVDDILRED